MTLFWLLVAGLILLALAFAVVPLLRRHEATNVSPDELNISVIQQQLAELDADLANGNLSEAQYRPARLDLEKELLRDVGQDPAESAAGSTKSGRWAIALVAVGLPLLALALYQTIGNQGVITRLATFERADAGGAGQGASTPHTELPPMDQLVERLAERLKQEPNNPQGWVMLARSYLTLGKTPEALAAYQSAYELTPQDPDLLVSYAQALVQTRTEPLLGRPAELINAAYTASPDHPNGLWLMGLVAFERKDYANALEYWQRLAAKLPPSSEDAANLDRFMQEARSRQAPSSTPALAASTAQPRETASPSAPPTPPASSKAVTVSVRLDPALSDRVSASDRVFIFARAAQGPRMPLAAVSKKVSDLPLRITLDDSMAMTPQFKLSSFPQVVVGARVSKSGVAIPQTGDLEGEVQAVTPGQDEDVEVVIDSVHP